MVSGSDQHAPLPPHYAFVVQLAAATQVETGRRHARVEHVISQHTTPFASLETLLALTRISEAAHEQAAGDGTPPTPHGGSEPPDAGDIG